MVKNMSKLSLGRVKWKAIYFSEVFDKIYIAKSTDLNKLDAGETVFIGRSSENNGLQDFVNIESKKIVSKNCITVSMVGEPRAFYHTYNFTCSQNILILRNDNHLNKNVAMYLCSIINNYLIDKGYGYGYPVGLKRVLRNRIMLPVDTEERPDWEFMEDYIKQEMKVQSDKVAVYYENKLMKLGFELLDLDVEWKEFWMEDILDIKSGVRLTKADQIDGNIPFIGASDANNGVTEFVGNTNKSLDSNVLGVNYNGSVVENFYHSYECIFSDDVKRIKFKNVEYGDEFTYLFLKHMILSQKNKYQYGYKFNAKRMNRQKIMLPIDKNGKPHWEYMSQFMKKLEKENIEKTLNHIYIYIYILAKKFENKYLLKNVSWKEFFIEDICEIKSGKDIYERDRIDGQTPYVTATANNNGIGYFISNENATLQEKCISVNRNGSVGYSFYHSYPALFGNDTRKLIPKYSDDHVAKFISFMISSQKEKYGYGYKMGTARLKRQKILLPVNEEELIDYDFMKKYIILQEIKPIEQFIHKYNEN